MNVDVTVESKFNNTSKLVNGPVAECVPYAAELLIGNEPDVNVYVNPVPIKLVIVTPGLALSIFKVNGFVSVGVGVGVSVGVSVTVGVGVSVGVSVTVGVGVSVGVSVLVGVVVDAGVSVGVIVGVEVLLGVGVGVELGPELTIAVIGVPDTNAVVADWTICDEPVIVNCK